MAMFSESEPAISTSQSPLRSDEEPAITPAGSANALLAGLVLAAVCYQMSVTMPTPATQDMIERLHTSGALVGLAQSIFFLASGVLAIVVASYSDFTERRRLLIGSMLLAALGLVLAAVAPSVWVLVLARALQSASGAVFPLALRILHDTLPPKRFGQAMGAITAGYGGVGGLDAILGGWLTDTYGFRAVFGVVAVLMLLSTVIIAATVPRMPATGPGRMDWLGASILSVGLIAVQLGIGAASGAPLGAVLGTVFVGLCVLVVFWQVEKRRANPLIPTGHLRSRKVWPLPAAAILLMSGFLSVVTFTVPVLSQDDTGGYHLAALTSSLLFLVPVCVVNLAVAPIAGVFTPRIGWWRTARIGLIGAAPVAVCLALAVESRWLVGILVPLYGLFAAAVTVTALNGLSVMLGPSDKPGVLPGIVSTCFGLGAALGITVAAQLASADESGSTGYRNALWFAALVTVLALVASFVVRRADRADQTSSSTA